MRLLKALFAGIAAFFGILFGGLVENIVGAFQPEKVDQVATQTEAAPPPVFIKPVITTPFVANEIPAPRPNRRPGKTMAMFKEMARDIPSARRA